MGSLSPAEVVRNARSGRRRRSALLGSWLLQMKNPPRRDRAGYGWSRRVTTWLIRGCTRAVNKKTRGLLGSGGAIPNRKFMLHFSFPVSSPAFSGSPVVTPRGPRLLQSGHARNGSRRLQTTDQQPPETASRLRRAWRWLGTAGKARR